MALDTPTRPRRIRFARPVDSAQALQDAPGPAEAANVAPATSNTTTYTRRSGKSGLAALADAVRVQPEGIRNNYLYWAVIRAVEEDHDQGEIIAQLFAAAIASGLEYRESLTTIRSGIERAEREGKRGSLAPYRRPDSGPTPPTFEEWLADPRYDESREHIKAARERAGRTDPIEHDFKIDWKGTTGAADTREPTTITTGPFTNIQDYCADIPDEVPWLAEPLAYFGGLTLLAGIWKGGKSTLIAQLLRARETGETFLGHKIPTGPTVLITEEGGIAVKRKVGALGELFILDRRSAVKQGLSLDDLLSAVHDFCTEHPGPALIVVDTFAVWGEVDDENDASEITKTLAKLTVLAQSTGAAVMLVDHVRKEGGTHGRAIRGSGAKAATVDIFAELNYVENGEKTDRSLRLEGRVIEPTDIRMSFNTETRSYDVIDRHEAELEEIEDWLIDVPESGDGLTIVQLAELWEMTRRTAAKHATWLTNKGRLRERKDRVPGNNAKRNVYWAIPAAAGGEATTNDHYKRVRDKTNEA